MVYLLLIFCTLAALACDIYIYRRVTSRHKLPRGLKILYIAVAFLVDTMAVVALLRMRTLETVTPGMMRAIMWAIGIFVLQFVPKLVYTVVSLPDYLVGMLRRKPFHIFSWLGVALAVPVAVLILHGLTAGRSQFRVEEVELTFEELPPSFDGLRVVQFSDLHIGTLTGRDRFITELRDRINGLDPDIVIQSGDIVNSQAHELDEYALSVLGGIRARYGVFSVLGNHDLGIYVRDAVKYPPAENIRMLEERHRDLDWTLLRNSSVCIGNGTDTITVSGADYPYDPMLNSSHLSQLPGMDLDATYYGIADSTFNITIAHAPQMWNEILERGVADLTLAGHVHAMQMKFRIFGRTLSPAQWMYDRWSGLYEEDGRYLYINDGLGYVLYPMRIGAKPELTLFVLRSASTKTEPR